MNKRTILVFGALPPPVVGMPVITKKVLEKLSLELPDYRVVCVDYWPRSSFRMRGIYKFYKIIVATFVLLYQRINSHDIKLYMPADAGRGLIYTLWLVSFSRLLKVPVFLHHHSWSYIADHDWRMGLICRIFSDSCFHIVLCSDMKSEFLLQYNATNNNIIILSNIGFLDYRGGG